MAGPEDFLPPSFWAASISCLFLSSSSICFFLACASASFFSCSSLLIFSSSALFWAACFFSCSARISFLAACLSFNLLSSASSLARSSLHWLMYSRSWSFISDFFCWSSAVAMVMSVFVRTVNIIEKKESGCIQLPPGERSFENVCSTIADDQQVVTMFSESYTPINCRSSIEGVFKFTYQYRFVATGICSHPEQIIHSCQNIGSQFLISNQKFNVTYKKCDGMEWTKDAVVEFSCLGDWVVGKNQY